ncbi:hypothetical protein SAMN04487974_102432 [Pelagibacterium luteolum]|uniref:CoxF protein n=2 Tax=Pelagibacterium luteolum TaxID=440168 RepID=A0A1G7TZA1_9HYPH|nr:hypothetical protein SAMN04487974_102432 [Pelagibacterium luteolum]
MVRSNVMTEPKIEQDQRDVFLRRRRKRSIAIGIALAVLVAIFYAITVAKLGPEVLQRDL